ncbi:T9SS-dependent choice-of-anchor J family protein [Chryseobacterium sp.]|uniref:T9SS-dependent choice-of-anchor J family protein n=1 Tax=Chryseobacterium sp. TaxID=1871047 RepID=UPI00289F86F3|nr:choice-of-anchor J domain-containing protein [Chryseobacterium sp.]
MEKTLLLASAILFAASNLNAQTNVYNFGFDTSVAAASWTTTNQSSPSTAALWAKASYTLPLGSALFGSGNTTTLPAGQAGGSNSFGLVNYTSTSGTGTISNWLITSSVNVKDGDVVSFYTRKGTDEDTDFPDRLELRYSTAATTITPSGGASAVGSFTNVGVTVNPTLADGFVYPQVWTKYSFTVTGVGSTPIPVKFGFRYYVTSGGPTGDNSDLIGIDTFSVDRPAVLATSDTSLKNKSISVYPNPTTDYLTINSDEKIDKAEVFDASGRKINVHFTDNKADVRNLQKGAYIINIETKEGKTSSKFIKK